MIDALCKWAPSETEHILNYELERGVGIRIWHKPWFRKKAGEQVA